MYLDKSRLHFLKRTMCVLEKGQKGLSFNQQKIQKAGSVMDVSLFYQTSFTPSCNAKDYK